MPRARMQQLAQVLGELEVSPFGNLSRIRREGRAEGFTPLLPQQLESTARQNSNSL